MKLVRSRSASGESGTHIYIRDAKSNQHVPTQSGVLAVYHYDRKTAQLRWSEQHLYGSSRLGMYQPEKLVTSVSLDSKQREVGYLGKQIFELSNHLGNVLATITDKKLQVSTNTTSTDYFEADVQTVQDYYAFGMQMPGRTYTAGSSYAYGFNGKRKDNDVNGEGNAYDFGARIYDPRASRFLSLDPLAGKYPFESPYSFAANSPIIAIDQDGKFPLWTHYQLIYENLIVAKVDKKVASEIALLGSTYIDHATDWYVMPYNKMLAANYFYNPVRLNYDNADYKETVRSQDDQLISSVSIHGMRAWWESITPEQAVNRALYGGTYKELDGTVVKIKGAYEVIKELQGKDISKLNRKEKKEFAQALHTIADVEVHKGARWVKEHKKEAKKMGHTNDHPDFHEVPVNQKDHDKADAATQKAIKRVQISENK